jgi:hypothetical protein
MQWFGGVVAAASATVDPDAWKMLDWYPTHYMAAKLSASETVTVDGKLDEEAWAAVEWSNSGFVDITQHLDVSHNAVPDLFQARVKLRWDKNYLFVGAELSKYGGSERGWR